MKIWSKVRRWRRARMRQRLVGYAIAGAQIAHLPVFRDRAPRHDLHRAIQSAFMRGFVFEQRAMRENG